MRPVAEAQFDGFMLPMVDHIVCHAARLRYRTRGRLTCPMVLRVPWAAASARRNTAASQQIDLHQRAGLRVVMPVRARLRPVAGPRSAIRIR